MLPVDKLDGKADVNFQMGGVALYFTKLLDKADGVEDGNINFDSKTLNSSKKNAIDAVMTDFEKNYQINAQANTLTKSTYGTKKNVLSTETIRLDSRGEVRRTEKATYDDKGKITELTYYNKDGKVMTSTSYDAKGNAINKSKALEDMLDKLDGNKDRKIDENNIFVKFFKSEIDKADDGADKLISGSKITSGNFNMIMNAKVNAANNTVVMGGKTYTLNDKGEVLNTSA